MRATSPRCRSRSWSIPARSVEAPPALEDDEEALERELERHVEHVERIHTMLERIERKVARELSDPDWLAATIEESMRREVRDAPQWEPRLAAIPRSTETNASLASSSGASCSSPRWRSFVNAGTTASASSGTSRTFASGRRRTRPGEARSSPTIRGVHLPTLSGLTLAARGTSSPNRPRDEAEDALLLNGGVRQGAGWRTRRLERAERCARRGTGGGLQFRRNGRAHAKADSLPRMFCGSTSTMRYAPPGA